MVKHNTQIGRDAALFSGQQVSTPASPPVRLRNAPRRKQKGETRTRAMVTAPIAVEVVRRTAVSVAGGMMSANAVAQVAHGPFAQGGSTLVWYSIAGMLSASFGASMLPIAKFAWERLEFLLAPAQERERHQQEQVKLYDVDVTCSRYLLRPEVLRAAHFAALAHEGQVRLTGDPYIAHCVETALIVEALHASSRALDDIDERIEAAVIAALLHDTVDDTRVSLEEIYDVFGPRVAQIVGQVGQLSTTTQLLRRRRRRDSASAGQAAQKAPLFSGEEVMDLRNMILAMVDEPLVLVVKLADRLHNMRTVYALRPDRQRAVAAETMQVWCSLAERLGMFSLKSELEDLCFAVVSPHEYRALRNELDCLWGLDSLPGIALSSQDRGEDSTVKHDGSSNSQIVISSNQTSINLDSSLSSCTTADSTPGAAQASGSPDSQESGGERQGPSLSIATDGTVSESACRKVVQSPSGVSLKLAEKPAASSNAAITVLDLRRSTAHPDSPEALDIAPAITAQVSAAELTRLSQHGSSEGTSSSGTSTAEVVQDPLDPPFAAQAALERQATNALASSSGRGQGSPAGEGSRARSPRRRRRQLTSRKEHWAAKAAAAVVAEAAKVGVSREPGKRRTLRRPPSLKLTPEQLEAWELIQTVPPFHATTFQSGLSRNPTRAGLDVLQECAQRLLYELKIEGLATGLDVIVEGRIKSLHSMHRKMARKGVSLREIFDARALRVVVDDQLGRKLQPAIEACYAIQPAVHRLWRPIRGELDDYIFNPKPSGYQSLHSAVLGPMDVPLEVQIRTSSMHEMAEYGPAAHWAYKDSPHPTPGTDGPVNMEVGQPVVRVAQGKLQLGVVLDSKASSLLVAVVVPSRIAPGTTVNKSQVRTLMAYVRKKKFWAPGHGNLHLSLESYTLCKDGNWHLLDTYNQKQPPLVMPLQNMHSSSATYESILPGSNSMRLAGSSLSGITADRAAPQLTSAEAKKVHLLRRMLEWQNDLLEEPITAPQRPNTAEGAAAEPGQVQILIVPTFKIEQVQRGTTAGDIIRTKGKIEIEREEKRTRYGPNVVNVNNVLVPEETTLADGDWVSLSPDLLDI